MALQATEEERRRAEQTARQVAEHLRERLGGTPLAIAESARQAADLAAEIADRLRAYDDSQADSAPDSGDQQGRAPT